MNRILIGKEGGAIFEDGGGLPRTLLGDKGFHPDYQDNSPEQSRHFWGLVSYGATLGPDLTQAINTTHETIEPHITEAYKSQKQALGNYHDYELSKAAINASKKLRSGKWSSLDFTQNLPKILKTKNFQYKHRDDLGVKLFTTIDHYFNNEENKK